MKPCEPFAHGGELLADVECPCCHSKGTMHYYKYSEILALENTVVCGACGTAFSELVYYTQDDQVTSGKVCGKW